MTAVIPNDIDDKAIFKVCEISGVKFDLAIEAVKRNETSMAKALLALKSPDCEKVVAKIKQAPTIGDILAIRKKERGVQRGPAVKRMIATHLIRQLYQIALQATAS